MTTPEGRAPARAPHARRAWRILFVTAALALSIGTHWPRLAIDIGGLPAPDKMLHAGAFGLVTLLLWMTGWVRRVRTLWGIALAWAIVDEITQGSPGLARTVSAYDAIASGVGVTLAAALIWLTAAAPARRAATIAQRRLTHSVDHAVSGGRRMMVILVSGAAGGLVGALVAAGIARIGLAAVEARNVTEALEPVVSGVARLFSDVRGVELVLLGLGLGALIGAHFAIEVLRRRALTRLIGSCVRCGTPMEATTAGDGPVDPVRHDRDDDGWRRCRACGEPWHVVSEAMPPIPARVIIELLAVGAMLMTLALVGVVVAIGAAVAAWAQWETVRRATLNWGDTPPGMSFVLDMLWLGVVMAVIGRFLRRRLARRVDAQGERCLGCRYDLRATPARDWRGNCPECGTAFIRVRKCEAD